MGSSLLHPAPELLLVGVTKEFKAFPCVCLLLLEGLRLILWALSARSPRCSMGEMSGAPSPIAERWIAAPGPASSFGHHQRGRRSPLRPRCVLQVGATTRGGCWPRGCCRAGGSQAVKELFSATPRSSLQIPFLLQVLTSSRSLNYTGASQEERKKKGEISPCLLRRASLSPREGRKAALQISLIW